MPLMIPPMGGDTSGLSTQEQLNDVQQRRALVQALMTQNQPRPIQAGGLIVPPSPLGSLATTLAGALLNNKLAGQEKDLRQQRGAQLAQSLQALLGSGQAPTQPVSSAPPITPPLPQSAAPASPPPPAGQGNVSTGADGVPEVTVTAPNPHPDAAGALSAALGAGTQSGGQSPAPAAPNDPNAARRSAAVQALLGLPLDVQQQIVGQAAGEALKPPKPAEPFTLAPGQVRYDASGNQVASASALPQSDLAKLEQDFKRGLISQEEYDAKRKIETGANANVVWESDGQYKRAYDAKTGQPIPGIAPIKMQLSPDQSLFSGGGRGDLLAALAARGVTLPAGLRSKEQQAATLDGLVRKFPDMSPDEIADKIASGQLDFTGQKKQVTVAGGQVGKVALGLNELQAFAPAALQASAAVPRGSFLPLNKLVQMGDEQISDPNLRDLKIKTMALLNAYDQVAARAGTDVGKRDKAHALLLSADSPETYARAVQAFQQEAQLAEQAAQKTMHGVSHPGGSETAPASGAPASNNTKVINGVTYVNVGGQWYQQ